MSGLFDLTGRVALVTGSSRGIGNALARALADAGATVVLNGINPERLKAAEAAMAADYAPGRVHSCAFDVTSDTGAARGIAWVEENVGPLDILVNNAGIQHRVPMLELDVADWERVISTDLTSAFLVGREAARHMIPRGPGQDHQHLLGPDRPRPAHHRALHRGEGRPAEPDPGHDRGMGRLGPADQRDRAGLHPHRDDPEPRRR